MVNERFRLDGKVAVVTGGSKGIGRAIALALAEAGADVALAARKPDELEKAAGEVEALGRRALAVPTDVGDPDQIQALMDRVEAELGGIDVLVNNAGAAPFSSTVDAMRPDGFEKYFRVNFLSSWYACRAAGPALMRRPGSCVLNVASVAGLMATPGLSYYGTAKAAMISLTKTLAQEWASSGIRVNAIAPGWIDTDMNTMLRASPDLDRQIVGQIPLGRWGTSTEIADAALFLVSPAASFVTGATLVVDGGQTVNTRFSP